MYYKFSVTCNWVADPEHEHEGCGGSVSDSFNCETMEDAKYFFLQKYPTARNTLTIRCQALELTITIPLE